MSDFDFDEKTVGVFGGVTGSVHTVPQVSSDESVKSQEHFILDSIEEYEFDEKTVGIFDSALTPKKDNVNINNNEYINKKLQNDYSKKFLILAIVFLILAIISLVFFPLAIVFAIIDVVFFVEFFKLKKKNR